MKNKGKAEEIPKRRFFRWYPPNSSEDHMELPIAFERSLAKPPPRTVTIRSQTGNAWKIALRRIDGKAAFGNGWKKFIRDNGVAAGEFMLFEYDGSQLFDVTIFSNSACNEIRCLTDVEESRAEDEDKEGESDDEEEEEEEGREDGDEDYNDVTIFSNSACNSTICLTDVKEGKEEDEDEDGESDDEDEEEDDDKDYYDDEVEEEDGGEEENEESVDSGAGYREEMENRRRKGKYIPFEKKVGRGEGSLSKGNDEHTQYLDNPMNPSFVPNLLKKTIGQMCIPALLIRDYNLKLGKVITFIDPLGKLVREVTKRGGSFLIKRFLSICRRNKIQPGDLMVCELLREEDDWVHAIKVHIIRK